MKNSGEKKENSTPETNAMELEDQPKEHAQNNTKEIAAQSSENSTAKVSGKCTQHEGNWVPAENRRTRKDNGTEMEVSQIKYSRDRTKKLWRPFTVRIQLQSHVL